MNDLLALVSKSIQNSVPSSNFPTVYPFSDIGNLSSTFTLSDLVMSILPEYVVLKSEFSSNLWYVILLTELYHICLNILL